MRSDRLLAGDRKTDGRLLPLVSMTPPRDRVDNNFTHFPANAAGSLTIVKICDKIYRRIWQEETDRGNLLSAE